MLTTAQRSEFATTGVTRLRGAFPARDAATMCERLWDELGWRAGIARADPSTWSVVEPRHLQALRRAHVFAAIASPAVIAAVDALLGSGAWLRPRSWGQALVTFPPLGGARGDAWRVPHRNWHFDWPICGAIEPLTGVKLMAYLAEVGPGGGGTVVVEGSHRLVARLVASEERPRPGRVLRGQLFASDPWLAALGSAGDDAERSARLVSGTVVDEVPVRVAELTGEPGDVILFHPWLLHAPAPNRAALPRLMVGQNLLTARGRALYGAKDD